MNKKILLSLAGALMLTVGVVGCDDNGNGGSHNSGNTHDRTIVLLISSMAKHSLFRSGKHHVTSVLNCLCTSITDPTLQDRHL